MSTLRVNGDGTMPMLRDAAGRPYIDPTADEAVASGVSVQASDPGAVGAGHFWLDSSGNFRVRNAANSDWLDILSAG